MGNNDDIFIEGFWLAIQELVLHHNEPTMALDIIRNCGFGYSECLKAQKKSGFENEKMIAFLKDLK